MAIVSYDEKSFLANTPLKKFYLDKARLASITDAVGSQVVVPPECEHRIDLFSYQQYGSSRLWWIIALANADLIKDPIWDFKSGMTLLVPDRALLNEQLPGVR